MPALPPPPPLLLILVPCAMVAMAVIGTAHADSHAKLQYSEQMKVMMQAADGGGSESGDSQSRAAAVVTFVVDVSVAFRGAGVPESRTMPKSFSVDLERQGAHVCGDRPCWLLTDKHIGASEKHLLKTAAHRDNKHMTPFLSWLVPDVDVGYACAVGKLHTDLQPAGARCAASSVGGYGPKGACKCPLQYSADKSSRRMLIYGPGVTASPPNLGWPGPKFRASERQPFCLMHASGSTQQVNMLTFDF